MKVHTLEREQVVCRSMGEVFAFFECPENLAKITPPDLGFEILTPTPILMQQGALIHYSIRMFAGIRTGWTTLITQYDPPHGFVDEQLKGPYTFWHHTHEFREVPEGTEIKDSVRYVMPFGLFGDWVHSLWVKRRLCQIFRYRAEVIDQYFAENGSHSE